MISFDISQKGTGTMRFHLCWIAVLCVAGRTVSASAPPPPKGETASQPEELTSGAIATDSGCFVEIPIVGEFQEGFGWNRQDPVVVPAAIEVTLQAAIKHNTRHIVFVIDSPGGEVEAARKIVAIMQKYDHQLEYHAVVNRGISAAIWIIFASDTIHVTDQSTLGGAIAFASDSAGNFKVSEKMNSILAAELATAAEAKHHSTILLRAMMSIGAAAYELRDSNGKLQLSATAPRDPSANVSRALDTEHTVLTLTGKEAIECELAVRMTGSTDNLGKTLGMANWKRATNHERSFEIEAFYSCQLDQFVAMLQQMIGPNYPGRLSISAGSGDDRLDISKEKCDITGVFVDQIRTKLGKLLTNAESLNLECYSDWANLALDRKTFQSVLTSRRAEARLAWIALRRELNGLETKYQWNLSHIRQTPLNDLEKSWSYLERLGTAQVAPATLSPATTHGTTQPIDR